jgi:hypothetical protein
VQYFRNGVPGAAVCQYILMQPLEKVRTMFFESLSVRGVLRERSCRVGLRQSRLWPVLFGLVERLHRSAIQVWCLSMVDWKGSVGRGEGVGTVIIVRVCSKCYSPVFDCEAREAESSALVICWSRLSAVWVVCASVSVGSSARNMPRRLSVPVSRRCWCVCAMKDFTFAALLFT